VFAPTTGDEIGRESAGETPIGAVDAKVTPTETDSREEETLLDVSSDTEEMESKFSRGNK
jgi:hypothetical protein